MSNREVIERYWTGVTDGDLKAIASALQPDIVVRYPQSGEVIRGRDNYLAMLGAYPGGLPNSRAGSLVGDQKTVVLPSTRPFGSQVVTVTGGNELFVGQGIFTYADGSEFYVVGVYRMKGGLVADETNYFGEPFSPLDWRSEWVELDAS